MAAYSRPMGTTSSAPPSGTADGDGAGASATWISQHSAPSAAAVRWAISPSAAGRSDVEASVCVTASSISARSTCSRSSAKRSAAWMAGPPAAAISRAAARWRAVNGRRRRKAASRPSRMPPAASGTTNTDRIDSSRSHARPGGNDAGTMPSDGTRRGVSQSARRPKGRCASVRAVDGRAKPSAACSASSLPSSPSSHTATASADTRALPSPARRRTTRSRSRVSGAMPPPPTISGLARTEADGGTVLHDNRAKADGHPDRQ